MDCADIVIGMARGQRFRIFDFYTRDRSTPRRDNFYGGDDDITAAVGNEVDGITSIKFRRPLVTGQPLYYFRYTYKYIIASCVFIQIDLLTSCFYFTFSKK